MGNTKDRTIAVRLGAGMVRFRTGELLGWMMAERLILADLNADTKLDLVAASEQDDAVDLFLGRGDGTLFPFVQYGAGQFSATVTVDDINRDGALDIVRGNHDAVSQRAVRSRRRPIQLIAVLPEWTDTAWDGCRGSQRRPAGRRGYGQ